MFIETTFKMEPWFFVNCFFIYSFLGYVFECILLTLQRQKPISHRGFVHGPFCIIYGFGAFFIYYALVPVSRNYAVLFFVGAAALTLFELAAGMAMLRFFGRVWWDYSRRPLNYKGIICLESSVGWGVLSVYTAVRLHAFVVELSRRCFQFFGKWLAVVLLVWYICDMIWSFCAQNKKTALNASYHPKQRKNIHIDRQK